MVQTADSALNNVQSMLQRVSELAVQYSNGDLSSTDKSDIQDEVNQLTQEIDRQRGSVQFNGINLLDGSAGSSGAVTFQVGAAADDTLTVSFQDIESSSNLGTSRSAGRNAASGGQVFDLTPGGAVSAISTAINNVSSLAATLGAVQNRLQYTSTSISTTQENMSSSLSSIQDVDMASEMTTLTQQQMLQQAGTAMLAQANSQPQLVLKLIRANPISQGRAALDASPAPGEPSFRRAERRSSATPAPGDPSSIEAAPLPRSEKTIRPGPLRYTARAT